MSHDNQAAIDSFAWVVIRRKARQLVGRAGFTAQDREDIEQDLALRLLESLRSYDPAQGHRNAFVTAVVDRTAAKILRDRRTKKRNGGPVRSLDTLLRALDWDREEYDDVAHSFEESALIDRLPHGEEEQVDLRQDLASVLEHLPADLRDLAERLKTQSVSEAARDLGMPRTTLQRRVDQLRQHFEEAGLRDYL